MSTVTQEHTSAGPVVRHVDVLIVGAGISGVGGAYHLTQQCPDKTFMVLESLESFGGTWLTHTYPGIRSDSDLYTFGYRFKPWTGHPIATAEAILDYMGEVIEENDLARHIHYHHRITNASWSSVDARWTLDVERTDTGERLRYSGNFLWMCQGYYRHAVGYTPEWPGFDSYAGEVIHPQTWPEGKDLSDKKVLVIGSGATAATLIPAIAGKCIHVTMLQRSPTYFIPGRNVNDLADQLREIEIPEEWIHEIVRRRLLFDQQAFTKHCWDAPQEAKDELLAGVKAFLPDDVVDKHFTPEYLPWRQRIAFVPDGDLFKAVVNGDASVVTGDIERFEPTGVRLTDGTLLEADVIVTATGFNLCVMGDIAFSVDRAPVDFAETIGWRGTMFTGVPNMAWVFGYFRASWTLRADMIADFVCRLLQHMDERGAHSVTPTLREWERDMPRLPWVDPENFNPGYLQRGLHIMPKQGDHAPWQHTQDYWNERTEYPTVDLEDGSLVYG